MAMTRWVLEDVRRFYDRAAVVYPVVDWFLARAKRRLLVKEVNRLPAGKLLEIGVGTGSHLGLYRRHEVTGIDISSCMLDRAKCRTSRVRLLAMDGENLEFATGSFDYAVLSHVLSVTPSPERMLLEARRVVRPGGRVLILNHDSPTGPLGWFDRCAQLAAPVLRCTVHFRVAGIDAIEQFSAMEQRAAWPGGYEKLFICHR